MLPDGIVSTGFPAVEATSRQCGLFFDPWQRELNRCILAKDADGVYAADMVVMSIPRQVGKTWDVGALVFADSIIHPGMTTVWTAHRFKVARETFDALKSVAQSPALAAHIDTDEITTAAGNECIRFRNGSRIVFAARERGAIRGFTKVARLILDEAQILTEAALSDLVPTMNQADNPQAILMGTPPKPSDPSEVFTRMRDEALSGDSDGVMYVEFAAEKGSDPDDRGAWRAANPSYPYRTSDRAMMRLRKMLSPEDFLREALGIWDDMAGALAFGDGFWQACTRDRPADLQVESLALAVSIDLTHAAVAAAGRDGDVMHVRPLQHGPGTGWVVDRLVELQERHDVSVAVDGRGPAAMLIPMLERAGVRLKVATTNDVLDACAGLFDLVRDGRVGHEEFPELEAAVAGAVKRTVGDRWAWGRRKSTTDISPLEAVTLAAWGVGEQEPAAAPVGFVSLSD